MPAGTKNLTQFLHLKKNFHDAIRDSAYEWELLPICQSLLKLRLENTKVKGNIFIQLYLTLRFNPNFIYFEPIENILIISIFILLYL